MLLLKKSDGELYKPRKETGQSQMHAGDSNTSLASIEGRNFSGEDERWKNSKLSF
jgi:hypothetical protein